MRVPGKYILISAVSLILFSLTACKPTAVISASPRSGRPPLNVIFDASKSQDLAKDISRYEWDFDNDGIFDSAGIVSNHTYEEPGTYSARLRVTDSKADFDETTATVVVFPYAAPIAVISMNMQEGEAPLEVVFDGSLSEDEDNDIRTYDWDFDNDGIFDATGINPVHIYETPGEYTARLVVTDAQNLSSEASAKIEVLTKLHVSINAAPEEGDAPLIVQFDGTGSTGNGYDPITGYEWDFDSDGKIDASGSTGIAAHTYSRPGKYTAKLIVTDSKGKKGVATKTIRSFGNERGYIPLYDMPDENLPCKYYLAVFDASSQAITETVEVPVNASGYAAHPSGRYLYFSHTEEMNGEDTTSIYVFDTLSKAVIRNIDIGSIGDVNSLSASPDGNKVYIATYSGLYYLNLRDDTLKCVSNDGGFYKMAFSRDGGTRLYAVNRKGLYFIKEIDTSRDIVTRGKVVGSYVRNIGCYSEGASPFLESSGINGSISPYVYLLMHDEWAAPQNSDPINFITWMETAFAGNYLSSYIKEPLSDEGDFNCLASNWEGTRLYTAEEIWGTSGVLENIINIIKIDTAYRLAENRIVSDIVTLGGYDYLSGFGVPLSGSRLFVLSHVNVDPEQEEANPVITCLSTDTLATDEVVPVPYHLATWNIDNFMVYSLNRISGRILSDGIPFPGYPVAISDGTSTKTSYTDEYGYYTFYMPDGSYELKFSNEDSICSIDSMPINIQGTDIEMPDVSEILHLISSSSHHVISRGENANFSWSSRHASSVSITPGIGNVDVNGSASVSPWRETTYTIEAVGGGRTLRKSVRVSVLYDANIVEFRADRSQINEGESVTLSWVIEDAEEMYLDGQEIFDSIGSIRVTPEETSTVYTIMARGTMGEYAFKSLTISVTPQTVFFHHDILGNTVAQTNMRGTIIMTAQYDPYGSYAHLGSQSENYTYTGKELDETGLYYFGARYYDPGIGRFLSIDPAGPDPTNPMTFNRYAYCLNNPYKYTDPDGRWERDVHYGSDKWGGTLKWAQEYFSFDSAKVVAKACNDVDSLISLRSFMPILGIQSYHFNTGDGAWSSPEDTRIEHSEYHLAEAIQLAKGDLNKNYTRALKELGTGLHALQDAYAHDETLGLVKSNGIFFYHDDPRINGKRNLADNPRHLPERIASTQSATSNYLRRFIDAVFNQEKS